MLGAACEPALAIAIAMAGSGFSLVEEKKKTGEGKVCEYMHGISS
jgi:hypothetical protein